MNLKDPKKVITGIFKKYVKIDGNIIYANKLFVINSIINQIYNEDTQTVSSKKLLEYGEIINRYLKNEVDILWKDGNIMVKEHKPLGKDANGE